MNIDDFLTFIGNEEDVLYLKTMLLDVNMRLFNNKKNPNYRRIVQGICRYLAGIAVKEMDGYKKPHGMSGANIGIPFNIIAIVRERNKRNEYAEVMINPTIIGYEKVEIPSQTNCGSIRLKDPITVMRYSTITLKWHDIDGVQKVASFNRENGGFTIQHEVDHNLGVLITDKELKLTTIK